jgi:Tol biopolymer transport system component/predicted Ser/Thr protein kinase
MLPSASIGHYRITSKLGEGGMGAVYRAIDTKLNREVAIKVLPPEFAQDQDRMQRFEREAQILATLNHANVAAIYSVEQGAIVMEMIDGEELKGPVPIETALEYARQIAAGLEAAHDKGVIHRDLKPANIKVSKDGMIKLLDFGLAKSTGESSSPKVSPTQSPTLSIASTQAGVILGTAAYMAPEQARGKPADKRSDIWAFGVVLFELLTGRGLYAGETVTDILAAVVLKEPDYSLLPPETPPRIRRLLRYCLSKDPKLRLRDIGDARLILDETEPAVPSAPILHAKRRWLPWTIAAAALTLGAAVGAVWMTLRSPKPPAMTLVRFPFVYPEGTTESLSPAATQVVPSPDGRFVAFVAAVGTATNLWVRPMDSPVAHRLEKTEGANFPFWSPDGRFLAYFADGKLKKIPAIGGTPLTLADAPISEVSRIPGDGGTWNAQDVILYSTSGGPLRRTSAAGVPGTPATVLDKAAREHKHSSPQFLPDGKHVLYLASSSIPEKSGIYVQELGSSQRVLVMRSQTRAVWAPPGYLLFTRESTLYAQHLDPNTFQLTGDPEPLAEEVTANNANGRSAFAVSSNGVLVYRARTFTSPRSKLTWVNRQGVVLSTIGNPAPYQSVRLSPDEKRAVVALALDQGQWINAIVDLATGVITPAAASVTVTRALGPWSPDSKRVILHTATPEKILEFTVDSGQSREIQGPEGLTATDWTPDGRLLLYADRADRFGVLPVDGGPPRVLKEAFPGQLTLRQLRAFGLSPDGKFVAFVSAESGRSQIVVASFPSFSEVRQVSADGGTAPLWSKDGRELLFRSDTHLMSVEIRTTGGIQAGVPHALFPLQAAFTRSVYSPSSDGKRFLIVDSTTSSKDAGMDTIVVLNWTAELKQR